MNQATPDRNKHQNTARAVALVAFLLAPAIALACGMFDVAIEKTGPAQVNTGGRISYTIKVTQKVSGGTAVNVIITDNIPRGLVFDSSATRIVPTGSFDPNQPQFKRFGPPRCAKEDSKVVCTIPYLNKRVGDVRINLSFTVPTSLGCPLIENKATVKARERSGEQDINHTNNESNVVRTSITGCRGTPTPTPTPSPSPSPSPTPTPTPSPSPTPTPTPTPSPSPSPSPTPTPTHSPSPTPTPTPSPSPSPSPTPTPSSTPKVEQEKSITITKTDHRDTTRPGHELTYEITVKNTGDVDIHDLEVKDEVPSQMTILKVSHNGSRSGNKVTWKNVKLDSDEEKTFTITVRVKESTLNNQKICNIALAKSEDQDLSKEDSDCVISKKPPKVAAAKVTPVKAVPITAKTGAAGVFSILATIVGGGALSTIIRRNI